MSEDGPEMDHNEIRYVYEDQEYVLDREEINSGLRDFICADGSRTILVDGQYIVTDSQAILLQDGDANLTQYYINDDAGGYVVDGEDASSANDLFESTEFLQLVEEDTNDVQQIIYYTNDDAEDPAASQEMPEESGVEGVQDEDGNVYPFKRIKLEGQMLNFDEFVQRHDDDGLIDEQNSEVQYALMEDGDYEIWNAADAQPAENKNGKGETEAQIVDLSKITGRNLITGQTVTLHGYMEKLKKELKNQNLHQKTRASKKVYADEMKRPELSDLLDKKISIGKTKSGKKIVGKIIHVERKTDGIKDAPKVETPTKELEEGEVDNLVINDHLPESAEIVQDQDSTVESDSNAPPPPLPPTTENGGVPMNDGVKQEEQTKILVKKCSVSKDSFEQISKTLGGVMEMESVRKKLENKNIVVKLVEKKYASETDTFIKSTSYSYGYMEKETNQIVNNQVLEKWKFVPDQNTQDVLLGDHIMSDDPEDKSKSVESKSTKFPITTSLTIVVCYGKSGCKTIRVNLNPAPGNLCTICAQYFKTNLQLRQHMNAVHNTYGMACEVCDKSFDDTQKLQEHKNIHVQEGRLFICSECNKCFPSQHKLHKHLPSHDLYLRPLECSVCEVRCSSEWALKKHLLTHTGIKPFSCDICGKQFLTQYDANFHKKIHFPEKHFACNICLRTFSRHSNLLRHTEIHKGSGALYKCEICYCSYNYISSLTRHMVQNHIDATDFRKRIQKM